MLPSEARGPWRWGQEGADGRSALAAHALSCAARQHTRPAQPEVTAPQLCPASSCQSRTSGHQTSGSGSHGTRPSCCHTPKTRDFSHNRVRLTGDPGPSSRALGRRKETQRCGTLGSGGPPAGTLVFFMTVPRLARAGGGPGPDRCPARGLRRDSRPQLQPPTEGPVQTLGACGGVGP